MTAFVLSFLFAIGFVAALVSLTDSALRGVRTYKRLQQDTAYDHRDASVIMYSNRAEIDVAKLAKTGTIGVTHGLLCDSKLSVQSEPIPVAA